MVNIVCSIKDRMTGEKTDLFGTKKTGAVQSVEQKMKLRGRYELTADNHNEG